MKKLVEIKIFIIEDDSIFSEIISDIIIDVAEEYPKDEVSIDYRSFYSSKEATYELSENPDIVLLDYYIVNDELEPDTSMQVLKDIKIYNGGIDVIIVSGQGDPEVSKELLELGATEYVGKDPDSIEKLASVLKKIIDQKIKEKLS